MAGALQMLRCLWQIQWQLLLSGKQQALTGHACGLVELHILEETKEHILADKPVR